GARQWTNRQGGREARTRRQPARARTGQPEPSSQRPRNAERHPEGCLSVTSGPPRSPVAERVAVVGGGELPDRGLLHAGGQGADGTVGQRDQDVVAARGRSGVGVPRPGVAVTRADVEGRVRIAVLVVVPVVAVVVVVAVEGGVVRQSPGRVVDVGGVVLRV